MVFAYILIGVLSGILGGMGLGGGTILIPLLTIVMGFNQQLAQGINLISFCLMSVFAIIIHVRNGYINLKIVLFFSIFAIIFAILGSLLANFIGSVVLKRVFGALLILISLLTTTQELKEHYKD